MRPALGVRARLSSLGHAHGRALAQIRSPTGTDHVQSPLSAHPSSAYPRPTKKVSSSSTLTLQGSRRMHSSAMHRLSPPSSRAGSSSEGALGGDDDSSDDEDESDEDARREEEAEKQDTLARKLQNLQRLMTKDMLGLVADRVPQSARVNGNGSAVRGRERPLSGSTSLSSSMAQRWPPSERSQSHQSLSSASVDSPQGSIPSIPSPSQQSPRHDQQYQYPVVRTHTRHHSQGYVAPVSAHTHYPARSQSQSQSLSSHSLSQSRSNSASNSNPASNPQSPRRLASPVRVGARHLGPTEKSSSPPALSPGSARGHTTRARTVHRAPHIPETPTGSEASSFSDLSGECAPSSYALGVS